MKRIFMGILIIAVASVMIIGSQFTEPISQDSAQVEAQDTLSDVPYLGDSGQLPSSSLESDVQEIIDNYDSLTIGVSVQNISTGDSYVAGAADSEFKAASTTKVLTAVYYMDRVEAGATSLSQSISGVPARTLIQRMLTNSDNVAWATLVAFLGEDDLQNYAHEIGMTSYSGYDYNTVTPSDYATLLVRLQSTTLISTDHRDLLYGFMQQTDNETLIPSAVGGDMQLYHKWGTVWGNLHDVAVIEKNGTTIVLVIYTKNEDGTGITTSLQTEAIQSITQTVLVDLMES